MQKFHFVFRDTNKNGGQEHQFFGGKFWRKIGVGVYTFLYVKKPPISTSRCPPASAEVRLRAYRRVTPSITDSVHVMSVIGHA
jgi:hypothetical protein